MPLSCQFFQNVKGHFGNLRDWQLKGYGTVDDFWRMIIVLLPLSASCLVSIFQLEHIPKLICSKVPTGRCGLYCLDVMFPFCLCLAVLNGGSLRGFGWVRIGCPVVLSNRIESHRAVVYEVQKMIERQIWRYKIVGFRRRILLSLSTRVASDSYFDTAGFYLFPNRSSAAPSRLRII